jgi:hypothetical protein
MSGIRLQLKHDSAASWASHNTVLRSGEVGYDTTNAKFVFGDGVTAWNSWTEDDFFTKASTSPGVWGMITGTLSSQTDLQAALDAKAGASATTSALATKAADSAVVHNTGNETIGGIKTLTLSPIVPTPTTNFQAATKKYVDDNSQAARRTITRSIRDRRKHGRGVGLRECGGIDNRHRIAANNRSDGW